MRFKTHLFPPNRSAVSNDLDWEAIETFEQERYCHGGPSGSQDSTTTTEPWSGQQGYLSIGFQDALDNVLNRSLSYFPGSTVTPFGADSEQAFGMRTDRAMQGNPLLGSSQSYINDVLSGKFLSPESNPNLGAIQESVMSTVQPAVDSRFAMAGRSGGSALANQALGTGISQGMSPYLFDYFNRERTNQQNAAALAPSLAREDYFDINQLAQVGAARDAKEYEKLQEEINRFNFGQSEPTNRLAQYMQLIQGNYGGTSTTSQQTSANPLLLGTSALLGAGGFPTADGGSVGGGLLSTVVCTEAHRQGFFDDDLLAGDQAFGQNLSCIDPLVLEGYHIMATPIVRGMRRSRRFCRFMAFLARPVAKEMAARAGYRLFGSMIGTAVLAVGLPFCRMIGRRRVAGNLQCQ